MRIQRILSISVLTATMMLIGLLAEKAIINVPSSQAAITKSYGYLCDTSSYQCTTCLIGSTDCIYSDSTTCASSCKAPTTIKSYGYSCNTATYQCSFGCIAGTTGCYSDTTTCASNCQAPVKYGYSCNVSTYQCSSCVIGTLGCTYADLTSCSSACKAPVETKSYGYSCDTSSYQCTSCVLGTTGCSYSDLTSCQSACQAPVITRYGYACNSSTYQCSTCVLGTTGCSYSDLTSCQSECQNPSTIAISTPNPASGTTGTQVKIISSNSGFTATGNTVHMRSTTNVTTDIPATAGNSLASTFEKSILAFLSASLGIGEVEAAGGYNTLQFTIPNGLAAGLYYITVTNSAGQKSIDPPVQFTINNDTTPPSITATPTTTTSTSTISVILNATDNAGGSGLAQARYILDATASPTAGISFSGSTTVTINKTGTGVNETHFLSVWAKDNTGNETPATNFGPYTIGTPPPPAGTCSFNPSDPTTIQKGLVAEWLRICGTPFKNYLEANTISETDFSITDPFDIIVQKLGIPALTTWQQTSVKGNIHIKLRDKLQSYVCQLKNKGITYSSIVDGYHLSGFPFIIKDTCTGGSTQDAIK